MNFTPSQQTAIDTRNCSLIISAGAGSGKTAVLTERILDRICNEKDDCNIDDFLIVTFTNAAAKELSDRIRKKLSERAATEPQNKKILNNLALLPLAKISTINSFCYELVRNNFQKLGLSAAVRIADEAEMAVIREQILNEVVDDYFENSGDDAAFLTAYEIFSSAKNDKGFIEVLAGLDRRLSSLVSPQDFCKRTLDAYKEVAECDEFFGTLMGQEVCRSTKEFAKKAQGLYEKLCGECSQYPDLVSKYLPAIECELSLAKLVLDGCDKGYEYVRKEVENAEKVSFKAIRNFENPHIQSMIKETKNTFSAEFRGMLEKMYSCSTEMLKVSANDTYGVLDKIFEIVFEFRHRVDEKKNALGIIEFSDAERYALSLLVERPEPFEVTSLAKQMRNRFKEVYIDEYQDVNPLQDMIFKALSRRGGDGGECSRFMVGDIKQSIYRFRGASPEIFMDYRDSFCDAEEDGTAKRIFMSDNFRCSGAVIEFTNILFENLMSGYFLEGDRLIHSRVESIPLNEKVKYIAFDYDKETAEGLSALELEAALISREIKHIVNNPEYTDADGRMYGLSDVAILARSSAALKVYESVLSSFGIAVESGVGESFYGKKEILLCMNILNAIDNPERDIYLAGFMRSFAGGFLDDELAIIKQKNKKMSLYRALINYSESGDDEALCKKCCEFVEKLRAYREYSRGKNADKLIWKLFCDMDLLNMCASDDFTKDKKGTRKNLLKLYQMARDFSTTSFKGVGAFIEYINGSMKQSDIKSEREPAGERVSIMTIHASKGLEFPICFVSDLGRKFNKSDENGRIVFSENQGVAISLCDTPFVKCVSSETGMMKFSTPYKSFITDGIDRELVDEEIRVLYVALTRARDMLIMTGAFPKKIENSLKDALVTSYSKSFGSCTSFGALLLSSLAEKRVLLPFYDAAGMDYVPPQDDADGIIDCIYVPCSEAAEAYKALSDELLSEFTCDADSEIDENLLDVLKKSSEGVVEVRNIPSKITVSRLKIGLIDEEKLSGEVREITEDPVPRFMISEESFTGAEKGTAMHMFMQFCNFENCIKSGCEKEAERLLQEGFIDASQKKLLDFGRLDRFFAGDFFKGIESSRKVYREQRFNLNIDAFDTGISGDILVQGVIDLFYENDDGTYTVVDFKTDRVFGEGAEEILIDRHRQQLMYYKRAVEEMTECTVKNTYIYSFSLMKQIEVK